MLTLVDGRQFPINYKGCWRPVWSWIDDQGRKLLDVTPHKKKRAPLSGAVDNSISRLDHALVAPDSPVQ